MGTKTVADYKLESRAENNLWPVTDDHRKECVGNALVDLNDENPKVRSAARDYLLAVDKAHSKTGGGTTSNRGRACKETPVVGACRQNRNCWR